MDNQYSLFSLRQLERERDEALDALAAKIPALEQLSREVDAIAHRIECLRDEIAVRRSNRVQWNGRPTRIEFVETN
jgi:cell division protein FtsB